MNAHEDDVNYLLKDKMMRKGFHYISKNSKEFSLKIATLRRNISKLAEDKLTLSDLTTVKNVINASIEEYINELRNADKYVEKIIEKARFSDAELILSELYFKSQIYFLYNEVFTYGSIDLVLRRQISKRRLDIEATLLYLSSYKGTAIHTIYRILANIHAPNKKSEFLKKLKTDKKFAANISEFRTKISDYFEDDLSPSKFYDLMEAAKGHHLPSRVPARNAKIDEVLVQLYVFIVDTQRKLFIAQNIYIKAIKKIFKKFPKLDKKYGGRKPKGPLLKLYLGKVQELKHYKLVPPNLYYNKLIFNLDEKKRLRLSDLGVKTIEAVISKKMASDIPLTEICAAANELDTKGIIQKDESKKKKPDHYIFMLELALGCNLNCTICFNRSFKRHSIITVDKWFKIIYSIPRNAKIILFGGEPFFYPEIGRILDFLQDTNKKEGRNWEIESFTNGVLTDKIINTLKGREKLKLIFSIDGIAKVHNTIRGDGAFEHATETIRQLKAETPHEIEVRSVVTAQNYKTIKEFMNFFKKLGVDKITFTDLHITGNAEKHHDYILTQDQRLKVLRWLGGCDDPVLTNSYSTEGIYPNSCGIGFNRIYIRSDGLVNGCSELDISDSSVYGAKLGKDGILKDARKLIPQFERKEFDNPYSDCSRCGLLYLCGGGCRVRALKQTGNINSCDVVQKADIVKVLERIKGH